MKRCLLLVIFLIEIIQGCKSHIKQSKSFQSVQLATDDSIFLALKDTAQAYMQTFIDSLNVHGKDHLHYRFLIKSDYIENVNHEHMWAQVEAYKDGSFNGLFVDSGYKVRNIHYGDPVSVNIKDVDDWSIANKTTRKVMGDFSDKYLKSKLKDEK